MLYLDGISVGSVGSIRKIREERELAFVSIYFYETVSRAHARMRAFPEERRSFLNIYVFEESFKKCSPFRRDRSPGASCRGKLPFETHLCREGEQCGLSNLTLEEAGTLKRDW